MYMVKFGSTVLNFSYDFFYQYLFLGHPVYVGVVTLRNKDISMLVNTLILLINFSHLYFSQVLQKIMRILSLKIAKNDEKEMN